MQRGKVVLRSCTNQKSPSSLRRTCWFPAVTSLPLVPVCPKSTSATFRQQKWQPPEQTQRGKRGLMLQVGGQPAQSVQVSEQQSASSRSASSMKVTSGQPAMDPSTSNVHGRTARVGLSDINFCCDLEAVATPGCSSSSPCCNSKSQAASSRSHGVRIQRQHAGVKGCWCQV